MEETLREYNGWEEKLKKTFNLDRECGEPFFALYSSREHGYGHWNLIDRGQDTLSDGRRSGRWCIFDHYNLLANEKKINLREELNGAIQQACEAKGLNPPDYAFFNSGNSDDSHHAEGVIYRIAIEEKGLDYLYENGIQADLNEIMARAFQKQRDFIHGMSQLERRVMDLTGHPRWARLFNSPNKIKLHDNTLGLELTIHRPSNNPQFSKQEDDAMAQMCLELNEALKESATVKFHRHFEDRNFYTPSYVSVEVPGGITAMERVVTQLEGPLRQRMGELGQRALLGEYPSTLMRQMDVLFGMENEGADYKDKELARHKKWQEFAARYDNTPPITLSEEERQFARKSLDGLERQEGGEVEKWLEKLSAMARESDTQGTHAERILNARLAKSLLEKLGNFYPALHEKIAALGNANQVG